MWNQNRIGEESYSNDSGHSNDSGYLLFFIIVSLREGGAFNRDFTIIFAPEYRAFSGALKIEKLKALLTSPAPRGPCIQMTGALVVCSVRMIT